MIDPYIVLGIKQGEATDELVANLAKGIIKDNHPDKHQQGITEEERVIRTRRFIEAKEAWDMLRTEEDRKNWEMGVTKQGMNEFLLSLVNDYTQIMVHMAVNNQQLNPKQELKKGYQNNLGTLGMQKAKVIGAIDRMTANIKKVKFEDEEDPLKRALDMQVVSMRNNLEAVESDISANNWKINYLVNKYDWTANEYNQPMFDRVQLGGMSYQSRPIGGFQW